MDKENIIKGLIKDIIYIELNKETIKASEKETIKAFMLYKLEYLKGLIKEL